MLSTRRGCNSRGNCSMLREEFLKARRYSMAAPWLIPPGVPHEALYPICSSQGPFGRWSLATDLPVDLVQSKNCVMQCDPVTRNKREICARAE
jgi:hypothetical protein